MRTHRPPINHQGFTLVEVLVALAIVAIALMAGLQATTALTRNALRQSDIVLAQLCADEGLFAAAGAAMARLAHVGGAQGGRVSPVRLLTAVFAVASLTTAVLSLDATVVLLTPVVLVTAGRVGVRREPHVYACAHLSNSASLLLPVSNLTNLLAFAASGLTFSRFAALIAAVEHGAVATVHAHVADRNRGRRRDNGPCTGLQRVHLSRGDAERRGHRDDRRSRIGGSGDRDAAGRTGQGPLGSSRVRRRRGRASGIRAGRLGH